MANGSTVTRSRRHIRPTTAEDIGVHNTRDTDTGDIPPMSSPTTLPCSPPKPAAEDMSPAASLQRSSRTVKPTDKLGL